MEANKGGAVLAWVGGVLDDCHLEDPSWRKNFCEEASVMVESGGLAGLQLNIEPCHSFEPGYLDLVRELREALAEDS